MKGPPAGCSPRIGEWVNTGLSLYDPFRIHTNQPPAAVGLVQAEMERRCPVGTAIGFFETDRPAQARDLSWCLLSQMNTGCTRHNPRGRALTDSFYNIRPNQYHRLAVEQGYVPSYQEFIAKFDVCELPSLLLSKEEALDISKERFVRKN